MTKREQQIVDRINSGWKLLTWAEEPECKAGAIIESPEGKVDKIQLALFWRMYNAGIINQRNSHPHDFYLTNQYIK